MTHYKAIATVTWKFESEGSLEKALEKARGLVDEIIEPHPQGEDFQDFKIQLDLLVLKSKPDPIKKIAHYHPDQVFALMTDHDTPIKIVISDKTYNIRMNSDRYKLFKISPSCCACGLIGTKFILQHKTGENLSHFQFYGEEDGRDVLMTRDHITPKSYGGEDDLSNYATLCYICNQIKGSLPLSYQSVNELRELQRNKERLTTQELRKRMAKSRLLLVDCLNGQ